MFRFNWVFVNKLALGSYPRKASNFKKLTDEGIKSILCLCDNSEIQIDQNQIKKFLFNQFPIPDHRCNRFPTLNEIHQSIDLVDNLLNNGPVIVHCFAGIERSPLICMAWIMKKENLSTLEALQYMMEVNPGTNPLPGQLKILDSLENF